MKKHGYTPINSTSERGRGKRSKSAVLAATCILSGGLLGIIGIIVALYLFADSLMKDRSRDLPRNKRLDLDLEYSSNKSVLGAQKSAEPLKAPWIKKFFTDTIPDFFTRIIPNILRSSSKHCGRSEHLVLVQYKPRGVHCSQNQKYQMNCLRPPQFECLTLKDIVQLSRDIIRLKDKSWTLGYCAINTKNVEKIPTELQFSSKTGCCSHPEFLKLPNNC